MHLQSLDIENLRVFKRARLSLGPVEPSKEFSNVHLILGTNGSGKTSVLRAIAMAAVGAMLPSSGMRPYSLVRRTGNEKLAACRIAASFCMGEQDRGRGTKPEFRSTVLLRAMHGFNDKFAEIEYPKDIEELLWDEESPAAFVVGYGASRIPEPEGVAVSSNDRGRALRYARISGLFEEFVPLKPLRAWLPQYRNKGRHTQVINLVNSLLEDVDMQLSGTPIDGEYLFESKGAKLPLSALSDGYKAYIGWVSDLLFHVCAGCPPGRKLTENQGIVLIDEIDLHPQWQRVVIGRLSKTLPNLQFFFTSHSPLIAGSVPAANTFVVDAGDQKSGAQLQPSPIDVYGWSADQILNSALFAQTPPRNPEATNEIRTLSVKARQGSSSAALKLMSVLADGLSKGEPPAGTSGAASAPAPARNRRS